MKWFQQNRWLGTFLIAAGICVLFAGILCYWTRAKWSDARQAFDKAAAERSRLQNLDPFPDDANYRKLKVYLENYSAALDKFKEELKKQVAPAPPLAPNEFQSRLRQATIATLNRARANNVKLPDKFQLGFDEFTTAMPQTAVAPLLGQELSQIQMLMNILLDAKVDSVTSFHRTPLAEERRVSPTPTPKPTPVPARKGSPARGKKPGEPSVTVSPTNLVERNIVNFTFKAAPAAARKVLNDIASSTGQFYIIRTLYVRNEKEKGPPREKTAGPSPAAGEVAPPDQAGNVPINFIVGNEHIEVSARIEMLRFTF
jgi:hypothetical protein